MDTVAKLGSLAHWFITENNARKAYQDLYPASKISKNYILPISSIRDDLNCGTNNDCEYYSVKPGDVVNNDLKEVIFCIACDQIFHLKCVAIDQSSLKPNFLPWICPDCVGNTLNIKAQSVVANNMHVVPFAQRRQNFLKPVEISDSLQVSNEMEHTAGLNAKGQTMYPHGASQIELLQKQLAIQARIIEELRNPQSKSKETRAIRKETNPVILKQQPDTSYADLILQNNRESTQIENQQSQGDLHTAFSPILNSIHGNANSTPQMHRNSSQHLEATIRHMEQLTLGEIRRSLPKIESFDGKPEKWLTFKRAVDRNWKEGKYSDELMKLQIRQALSGQALARVDGLMDILTAEQIMQLLKESYGNTNIIVDTARQKLMNVKLSKPLTHASCVEVTTYIANYIASCTYAGLLVADLTLSLRIHNQLEALHQQAYYEYYFSKFPNATTRLERLDIQLEFLNILS
jgi:hypothetical protein